MSRASVIAANARAVVGIGPSTSGVEMSYRRLTSKYGVEPRTYSSIDTFIAMPTAGAHSESYDTDRSAHTTSFTSRIRAADDSPTPHLQQGDQIIDDVGVVWAVMGVGSSGYGTVAYAVTRARGLLADADRKGGV